MYGEGFYKGKMESNERDEFEYEGFCPVCKRDIDSGLVSHLEGFYSRIATALIESGKCIKR